jgi:hypothetical protein
MTSNEASAAIVQTLMTGLAFGESPRWHMDRLWFCNWVAQEVIAVDLVARSEVILQTPSFPFSIDWLPDGHLLVVSGREGQLLRREADGSLVTHADLRILSRGWNEIVVDGRGNTYVNAMLGVSHPVGAGFVASLARPGGNVTGITNQGSDLEKSFELLRELVPDLHRVFVLWQSDNPGSRLGFENLSKLATRLGRSVSSASLARDSDLEPALASIAADLPHALYVHPVPIAFRRRREIAAFAAAHHLPTYSDASEFPRDGLLLSYGPDSATIYRRAGFYVDRLLRGVKAGELPVEQPTKFDLVINLRTAKAIDLTIPPSMLARADEVIE